MKNEKLYVMKRLVVIIFHLSLLTLYSASAQTLTLEQCLERARQYNRELRNAALDIQAATEQKHEVFTYYFPRISANVIAFQFFDELINADGTLPQEYAALSTLFSSTNNTHFSISEFNRIYALSATLLQPLYYGGQIINGNKLARLQEDVMTLKLQMTESEMLQKVTECYWQLACVRYNLNTIESTEKLLDAVSAQVNTFLEAGVTTRNSLLKVRLRQQEISSLRLKLENTDHILRLLLAQQIGITPADADKNFDIVLEDKPVEQPIEIVESPLSFSPEHRVELQLTNKAVDVQALQVKMERGKYVPHLGIGVGVYNSGLGGFSNEVRNYVCPYLNNGFVFGSLSIPISDWWGGSHAIRRQKIRLKQAQILRDDARELLQIDIERAWTNLQEAYKQTQIAEASCDEAAENLRITSDQYKMSTCTLTELLDAETLNRKAQNDLAQAKANYQIALANYRRKMI